MQPLAPLERDHREVNSIGGDVPEGTETFTQHQNGPARATLFRSFYQRLGRFFFHSDNTAALAKRPAAEVTGAIHFPKRKPQRTLQLVPCTDILCNIFPSNA